MPPDDEDLLPLSALQHLVFCERQCALIHMDREWAENQKTAEGQTLHQKVDEGYRQYRRGLKQYAGIHVRSLALGIQGRLDMLELLSNGAGPENAAFLGLKGNWRMHPVEFKRGRPKRHDADRVQLCAQAICLEEMTGFRVEDGSLFYGEVRRREEVALTEELRTKTHDVARRLRILLSQDKLPPPVFKRHCSSCSLLEICQPRTTTVLTDAYRKELLG